MNKKSISYDTYQEIADSYASLIDTKPHNAYYDRPAVQSLIGDIKNQKILDAGCGPGAYIEWLIEQGAKVTGIDASEAMLSHAKKRNGDHATYIQANLEEPLDIFPDDSFDGIISALTITYVDNQNSLFKEFNRILHLSGWIVFSTEHPFFSYNYNKVENYFATKKVVNEWSGFGKKVQMHSYYHSLSSLTDALTDNGFSIEKILEPKPTKEFKIADYKNYEKLVNFPLFICIRARKISIPYGD